MKTKFLRYLIAFLMVIGIYFFFMYFIYTQSIKMGLKFLITFSFLTFSFIIKNFFSTFAIASPLLLTLLLRWFFPVHDYYSPHLAFSIIDFFSLFYIFKLLSINFKLKSKEFFAPFILTFLFLIILSSLFSKSIKHTYIIFLFIFLVSIYYISLVNEIDNFKKLYLFIFFITLFSIFNSFVGFLQWKGIKIVFLGEEITKLPTGSFWGAIRVRGILSHMNSFPAILAFLNPVFLAIIFCDVKKYIKIFSIIAIIFSIPAIIFSLSRAGYICAIMGFFTFFILYLLKEKKKEELIKISQIVLFLLIILIFLILFIPQVKLRIIYMLNFQEDPAAITRFNLWKNSIKTFLENPFGIGWGNFGLEPYSQGLWRPHNLYVHIMVELGIGGLIFLILSIFYLSKKLYQLFKKTKEKNLKFLTYGTISSWIIFLFHNFFESIWIPYYHNMESLSFAWLLLITNFLLCKLEI
jgi:O-antigen ligase